EQAPDVGRAAGRAEPGLAAVAAAVGHRVLVEVQAAVEGDAGHTPHACHSHTTDVATLNGTRARLDATGPVRITVALPHFGYRWQTQAAAGCRFMSLTKEDRRV